MQNHARNLRVLQKVKSIWDEKRFPFQETPLGQAMSVKALGANDDLDKMKFLVKKFPGIYNFLVRTLSPVCPTYSLEGVLVSHDVEGKIYLNIGSGNSKVHEHIINVDLCDYENVNIVADATNLPLKDNSVDGIVSVASLEHIPNPQGVVAEMYRVLKPGGFIDCAIPFMQPFHASPYDFTRFTKPGMRELFRRFDVEVRGEGGPTSAFLWVLQEWMATLLSFGSTTFHKVWFLFFTLTLWPLKFIDFLLIKYPSADNINALFRVTGRKPKE